MNARISLVTSLLLAVAAFVSSCEVISPQEVNSLYEDVFRQRHTQYRLKEVDTFRIKIYDIEDDFDQEDLYVLFDGHSDLFYMHDFEVAGKTIDDLEEALRPRIAEKYKKDTDVQIQILPREERVIVVGEFERPAIVPLVRPRMTVSTAVSVAGGLKITADSDYALLRRPYGNPLYPALLRIDLNDESEQILLLPGDQIWVQKNGMAMVIAYMREYIFGPLIPVYSTASTSLVAAGVFVP